MDGTWTIGELAEQARAALTGEPVQVNGRVRELPNERLIRWYTTIGLLDPPLARRGRTALYGPRHLLQLVAVKRRQAVGQAIAEIQAELAGATDDTLRAVARLPEPISPGAPDAATDTPDVTDAPDTPVRRSRSRDRFWAEAPSPAAEARPRRRPAANPSANPSAGPSAGPSASPSAGPGRPVRGTAVQSAAVPPAGPARSSHPASHAHAAAMAAATPEGPGETDESEGAESAEGAVVATTPAVVPGIRLAAGVTLLLDGDLGPITAADLAAIEVAARPLLNALRSRGLHTERTPEPAKPADLPGSPESSEPAASPDSAEATEPHPPPHPPGRRSM